MAQRTKVASFPVTEDMDFGLRRIEREFEEGEFGEVVFRLNRKAAETATFNLVSEDVDNLSDELERRGMTSWPGKELVTLNWDSKTISIRFVQTRTPYSMYQTPAFIGFALIAARAAAASRPILASRGFFGNILRRIPGIGSKFLRLGQGLTRSSALLLVGGGLLVWSLIDPGSLVEVFKWVFEKAKEAATELLKSPLILGAVVLAVGVVLILRGK